MLHVSSSFLFFFNDTSTTEIYTLSLHDALPISFDNDVRAQNRMNLPHRRIDDAHTLDQHVFAAIGLNEVGAQLLGYRSEEHTSELQSQSNLVCRLLLEKKKKKKIKKIK